MLKDGKSCVASPFIGRAWAQHPLCSLQFEVVIVQRCLTATAQDNHLSSWSLQLFVLAQIYDHRKAHWALIIKPPESEEMNDTEGEIWLCRCVFNDKALAKLLCRTVNHWDMLIINISWHGGSGREVIKSNHTLVASIWATRVTSNHQKCCMWLVTILISISGLNAANSLFMSLTLPQGINSLTVSLAAKTNYFLPRQWFSISFRSDSLNILSRLWQAPGIVNRIVVWGRRSFSLPIVMENSFCFKMIF